MKTRRRRRKARSALRNPSRRRRSRRARVARRNPSRRRRSVRSARRNPSRRRRFSRRNPGSGIIAEFTSPDMLATAGGLIAGTIGAGILINKLSKPGTSLPGLDPAKPSPFARTLWKVGIVVAASYFTKNKAPRVSEGLMLSGAAILGSDLLAQSGLLTKINNAAGVSRYYGSPRGAAAYMPGVNPTFTGPGSRFLAPSSVPRLRRPGAGAALTRSSMNRINNMVENPFAN